MTKLVFSHPLKRKRSSMAEPLPFGVSVRKAGRRTLTTPVTRPRSAADLFPVAVEEVGPIQGQKPGSIYEWRLAQALLKAGFAFDYQVAIYGGRQMRGGQVVDFLVHTVPLPTPVFADGEHWHEGSYTSEDRYKRAYLNASMGTAWNPWVSFFGPELHSVEAAYRAVRRALG
jgi:hypothetical protein